MTSSSSPALDYGLDTMLVVYCVLNGHPARTACHQFLHGQSGWFTSPLVLFEAKAVLTKVYAVDPAAATTKLATFSTVPVTLVDLDASTVDAAFQLADVHGVDTTDAVLLQLAINKSARSIATDDQHLAQVCGQFGINAVSPLDAALRAAVAVWEAAHVPPKGSARVLWRVHQWLNQAHPQAAQDFWSQTGGGSHLPGFHLASLSAIIFDGHSMLRTSRPARRLPRQSRRGARRAPIPRRPSRS
jgi:predicted nucleic acid-binding protein